MSVINANAARGRGVGVQLPGENNGTRNEKAAQVQGLARRFGMSEALASVVLGLLREEPWK